MFDDEKIRIIESMPDADTILICWIKLLSLAGKQTQMVLSFSRKHSVYR